MQKLPLQKHDTATANDGTPQVPFCGGGAVREMRGAPRSGKNSCSPDDCLVESREKANSEKSKKKGQKCVQCTHPQKMFTQERDSMG